MSKQESVNKTGKMRLGAARWLDFQNQLREHAALVAELEPLQAHRVGYLYGWLYALDMIEHLQEACGRTREEALAECRAYGLGAIHHWAVTPTEPGQEVIPLIRMMGTEPSDRF